MSQYIEPMSPHKDFESIKQINEVGVEFWEARKFMVLLEYSEWRNFLKVVEKAQEACNHSNQTVHNHFVEFNKMVDIGSGAKRSQADFRLSRFACYLIAQNGDSSKPEIALAQIYFAVQTRKQEIFENLPDAEKRVFIRSEVTSENKKLFKTAKDIGVSKFGLFNDAGYRGLYGMPLSAIEDRKGIKKGDLLDTAGSTELAANLFRITQTDEKLTKGEARGDIEASKVHNMVGGKVRQTIKDIGGELPETLKPERHIREVKKDLKKLKSTNDSLPEG